MFLECYNDMGDNFCIICGEEIPCSHYGMEEQHICMMCGAFLSDCVDEDDDGECDFSGEYFPH